MRALDTLERRVSALEALLAEPPPPPPTSLLAGRVAPSLRGIAHAVGAEWGVTLAQLLSDRRDAHLVEPRHAAWWLARHLTDASFPVIARSFQRDHTTVIHGCRRMALRIRAEAELAARIARAAAIATPSTPEEA